MRGHRPVLTDPPDNLSAYDRVSLLLWAQKKGLEMGPQELIEAEEIVLDWARSGGKRKASWLATVRNAIRLGWALESGVRNQTRTHSAQPRLTFEEEQGERRRAEIGRAHV